MSVEITMREARPEDAALIARVHVKSWKEAYRGIIHASYLDERLSLEERTRSWEKYWGKDASMTFLAFDGDALAGFATVGTSRSERFPGYAELYAIYLDPEYLGRGVGKALFECAVSDAVAQGFDSMFAYVLLENQEARGFYERMGGALAEGSEIVITIDGHTYPEVAYVWRFF